MAEAKERSEWNRASVLIAKLHNVNQVKRSDLISFEDIHPYYISKRMDKSEPTQSDLATARNLIRSMR